MALWVAEFENEKYQDYSDDDDESDDDMSDARSDSTNRHAAFTEAVETRMPFKKVEEVIVTLSHSEYTWTGFLRDSPETITMAIVTSSCLEVTDNRVTVLSVVAANAVGGRAASILQSAIPCNPNLLIRERGNPRELTISIRTGAGAEQRMSIVPRVENGGSSGEFVVFTW